MGQEIAAKAVMMKMMKDNSMIMIPLLPS